MLNRAGEEMPSTSDVADAKYREFHCTTWGRILWGFTHVRTPRSWQTAPGSLKVEVAKKVELEERIEKENRKLVEIRDNPQYDDEILEDIRKRIA